MSQIGMQMPGAGSRRAGPNVYTGLLFAALVALMAACVYLGVYAMPAVGKDGQTFGLQEAGKIAIKDAPASAPAPGPRGGGPRNNTGGNAAPKPAETPAESPAGDGGTPPAGG